jgi:hypothetical protein
MQHEEVVHAKACTAPYMIYYQRKVKGWPTMFSGRFSIPPRMTTQNAFDRVIPRLTLSDFYKNVASTRTDAYIP